MQVDDDDDSGNDSDYNPANDPEVSDKDAGEEVAVISNMSHRRKRKVDSIWDEMIECDKREIREKMNQALTSSPIEQITKSRRKLNVRLHNMLRSIFGDRMISKTTSQNCSNEDSQHVKEVAENAVKHLRKKVKIAEVRKFAGQEIM